MEQDNWSLKRLKMIIEGGGVKLKRQKEREIEIAVNKKKEIIKGSSHRAQF